jgi:hypothetical protein
MAVSPDAVIRFWLPRCQAQELQPPAHDLQEFGRARPGKMTNSGVESATSERFLDPWYYRGGIRFVKTAVSIPGPVFQAAERLAKSLRIPRSHLYSRAIERYVSEAQQRNITTRLNQVYANEKVELDPALAILQWASVLCEPW